MGAFQLQNEGKCICVCPLPGKAPGGRREDGDVRKHSFRRPRPKDLQVRNSWAGECVCLWVFPSPRKNPERGQEHTVLRGPRSLCFERRASLLVGGCEKSLFSSTQADRLGTAVCNLRFSGPLAGTLASVVTCSGPWGDRGMIFWVALCCIRRGSFSEAPHCVAQVTRRFPGSPWAAL